MLEVPEDFSNWRLRQWSFGTGPQRKNEWKNILLIIRVWKIFYPEKWPDTFVCVFVSLNTCQDACLSPVILYLKISPTSWKKASLERGGTYDLQEKETSFKRQYQESYFNYGFIATGDSHGPNELGRIFGDKQMRQWGLRNGFGTWRPIFVFVSMLVVSFYFLIFIPLHFEGRDVKTLSCMKLVRGEQKGLNKQMLCSSHLWPPEGGMSYSFYSTAHLSQKRQISIHQLINVQTIFWFSRYLMMEFNVAHVASQFWPHCWVRSSIQRKTDMSRGAAASPSQFSDSLSPHQVQSGIRRHDRAEMLFFKAFWVWHSEDDEGPSHFGDDEGPSHSGDDEGPCQAVAQLLTDILQLSSPLSCLHRFIWDRRVYKTRGNLLQTLLLSEHLQEPQVQFGSLTLCYIWFTESFNFHIIIWKYYMYTCVSTETCWQKRDIIWHLVRLWLADIRPCCRCWTTS